jgi:hypothetical protein
MHSKRVRTRRSGHSKEILEPVSRSNESVSELNVHSWEHLYRPTIDGSVVNGEISLNDTNIQNVKDTTMQSLEESSVDLLRQTEGGISVSLDETYMQPKKGDPMSFGNFNVQPEREDLQINQNKSGNGTQILTEIASSLQQYPYNTAVRPTSQPQHNTLNNIVVEPIMKNVTSENTTRSLNTQYLHNISRSDVKKNISSENITRRLNTQYLHNISRSDVRRSDSNLNSVRTEFFQSPEITTPFTKSYDTLIFSPDALSTSNHESEVLHTPEMNNSNTNDFNHPSTLSISPLALRTKNLTTPFPELNRNLSEVQKQVIQAANNNIYTVHSNISNEYSAPQMNKLPEGEPVLTLIPGKVPEVPSVNQNISSFTSSRVFEKNIQTTILHTSFHSETSINSTTSIIPSPIFNSSTGTYINSKISSNDFSITTNSTESGIASEGNTVSHNVVSEDDSLQTTLVPVSTANSSTVSLATPAPHSTSSSFNTSTKIMETWNTNAAPTESSVGNISSSANFTTVESINKIFSNAKPVEGVISNIISNTAPSLETATSGTILNTVVSVEDVTSGTISSNDISEENVSSREISSTVQSVETLASSTLSSAVALVNVTSTAKYSSSISSTVQSLEAVTSNTIPSIAQSSDDVTSGTIFNAVLSAEASNTIFPTVQSAKTLTSNSLPSALLLLTVVMSNASSSPLSSVESVTKSTRSTTPSSVPSMDTILPTKAATQRDKFQVDIVSGRDESSHTTEEETDWSFNSPNDNSNTTYLEIIHEVNMLMCKQNKIIFPSINQFLVSKHM